MPPEAADEPKEKKIKLGSVISQTILLVLFCASVWLAFNPEIVRRLIDGKPCEHRRVRAALSKVSGKQ